MKSTSILKKTVGVLALMIPLNAYAALLLVNGDFQTGSNWNSTGVPSGWTGSNSGGGYYGESITAPISYSGGTRVAALRPYATTYYQQTIGLLSDGGVGAAAGITINLDAGIRSHSSYDSIAGGITQTLEISLWNTTTNTELGTSTFSMVTPTAANAVDLTAQQYTINYDATGIETNDLALRFQNITNGGSNQIRFNMLIDNVTVAAVPEPSSTALLGLGGLTLILRRRK